MVGLARDLVFFVLDLSTRRVEVAGIAPAPKGLWMSQVARNLVVEFDGFLIVGWVLEQDGIFSESTPSTTVDP